MIFCASRRASLSQGRNASIQADRLFLHRFYIFLVISVVWLMQARRSNEEAKWTKLYRRGRHDIAWMLWVCLYCNVVIPKKG